MIQIDIHIVSQLFWTYAVSCHGCGDIISRNDRVRDAKMAACSRPGVFAQFFTRTTAALDVTITSPLQVSLISDAARTGGFALTLAENRNIGQF